jgi:hypothetical protein
LGYHRERFGLFKHASGVALMRCAASLDKGNRLKWVTASGDPCAGNLVAFTDAHEHNQRAKTFQSSDASVR